MSANQEKWPGAQDTTLASTARRGLMARWSTITSTVAGFAFAGTGEQRKVYVPLATALLAGALAAADFTKLATLTQAQLTALLTTLDPPRATLYRTTNQSVANVTMTPVSFDTAYTNGGVGGNPWAGGAPTRFTVATAGTYAFTGHVTFAASAAGAFRLLRLRVNGASDHATTTVGPLGAANFVHLAVAGQIKLNAADYVELCAYQDSGGALNVLTNGVFSPHFGGTLLVQGA